MLSERTFCGKVSRFFHLYFRERFFKFITFARFINQSNHYHYLKVGKFYLSRSGRDGLGAHASVKRRRLGSQLSVRRSPQLWRSAQHRSCRSFYDGSREFSDQGARLDRQICQAVRHTKWSGSKDDLLTHHEVIKDRRFLLGWQVCGPDGSGVRRKTMCRFKI